MKKERLISPVLWIVMLASAASAQSARPSAASAAPNRPAAQTLVAGGGAAALLSSWQIRPNDNDGYFSSDIPQPVCGLDNGLYNIYIFTNFDYYPSKNFHNHSNAVRVGAINTPADTYQLLSSNVANDAHSLPGTRWEFAAASVTSGANSKIYLFGGRNSYGEFNDVYSYTPGAGFSSSAVATIPTRNGIDGKRSGAVAVPAKGMIYLFGGQQGGNSVLKQVLEFDPQANQFTSRVLPPMPEGFHGARGMTKAVGTNNYIYLVGARTTAYGAPNYKIYRFDVQSGVTQEVKDFNNPSAPLTIPNGSGYPMITWDTNGNVRILAASGNGSSGPWTWGNIQAWVLNDNYTLPNDGNATLTPAPYNNAARARDMAGAVKCGDGMYLVGGTYGHGTTFQNRGMLVDKLGGLTYGPAKTIDIKVKAISPTAP
jgi:hypothetical protein